MTAMRTLYIEMVDKFANEVSARMVCFHQVHVLVDVQLSLAGLVLACYVNL